MVAYQLDDERKSLYRKNEKRGETHHFHPFQKKAGCVGLPGRLLFQFLKSFTRQLFTGL